MAGLYDELFQQNLADINGRYANPDAERQRQWNRSGIKALGGSSFTSSINPFNAARRREFLEALAASRNMQRADDEMALRQSNQATQHKLTKRMLTEQERKNLATEGLSRDSLGLQGRSLTEQERRNQALEGIARDDLSLKDVDVRTRADVANRSLSEEVRRNQAAEHLSELGLDLQRGKMDRDYQISDTALRLQGRKLDTDSELGQGTLNLNRDIFSETKKRNLRRDLLEAQQTLAENEYKRKRLNLDQLIAKTQANLQAAGFHISEEQLKHEIKKDNRLLDMSVYQMIQHLQEGSSQYILGAMNIGDSSNANLTRLQRGRADLNTMPEQITAGTTGSLLGQNNADTGIGNTRSQSILQQQYNEFNMQLTQLQNSLAALLGTWSGVQNLGQGLVVNDALRNFRREGGI